MRTKDLKSKVKQGDFVETRDGTIYFVLKGFNYHCSPSVTDYLLCLNKDGEFHNSELRFYTSDLLYEVNGKREPDKDIVKIFYVPPSIIIKLIKNGFKYEDEKYVSIIWEETYCNNCIMMMKFKDENIELISFKDKIKNIIKQLKELIEEV